MVEWHPAKLLCVRFDVKPPFADASVVGVAPVSKSSKFDIFGKVNELPSTSREKETRAENEKVLKLTTSCLVLTRFETIT